MSRTLPAAHPQQPPAKGRRKRLKSIGYAVAVRAGIYVAGFIIGALVGAEHRDTHTSRRGPPSRGLLGRRQESTQRANPVL